MEIVNEENKRKKELIMQITIDLNELEIEALEILKKCIGYMK